MIIICPILELEENYWNCTDENHAITVYCKYTCLFTNFEIGKIGKLPELESTNWIFLEDIDNA